jgi:hypothetical protein
MKSGHVENIGKRKEKVFGGRGSLRYWGWGFCLVDVFFSDMYDYDLILGHYVRTCITVFSFFSLFCLVTNSMYIFSIKKK